MTTGYLHSKVDGIFVSRHPLRQTWKLMHFRCGNPSHKSFELYGGRGIKVCKRWVSFENFVHDMGPRPVGYTLERKKNAKGYSPANCVWAPWYAQHYNKRRQKNNKSGATGVVFVPPIGKYRAYMKCEGKTHIIGNFINKKNAIIARKYFVEGYFAKQGGIHGECK